MITSCISGKRHADTGGEDLNPLSLPKAARVSMRKISNKATDWGMLRRSRCIQIFL